MGTDLPNGTGEFPDRPLLAATVLTLRDRLAQARRARFVGREAERELFAGALAAEPPPFHIVHVYGPGGIGKTTLLDEYRRLSDEAGVPVATLDGHDLEPSPAAVAEAAAGALAGTEAGRRVLLVDTYEALVPLDGWFRRTFVPDLSAGTLVVFAGRHRPAPEWRAEWAEGVVTVPLRNLSRAEGTAFLDGRGVPEEAHGDVLAFTHGHPLALALVAERVRQRPGTAAPAAFDPDEAQDVVRALLDRFVAAVPTPAHRAAVEAASVVRALTEPLLADLTDGLPGDGPSAHALFAWLRGLAFVEADPVGLRLHDLVRDLVGADLRWRDPARHAAFHARARRHYTARLREAAAEADRQRTLRDYVHLYRDNPVVRPLLGRLYAAWEGADLEGSGPLAPGEAAAVRALVERHEGAASAEAVGYWLGRRPDAFEVFRARGGGVAGFLLTLPLDAVDDADREADPATRRAWDAVGARLRPGDRALLFRSWMDAEAYQDVSAVQSLVFARTVQLYLSTPRLALSLLPVADPDLWAPALAFAGLARWPEAEFEVGGRPHAVFGKDWRATPPTAWLDTLADRVPAAAPAPPAPRADAPVVLGEDAFAEAVREALKAYARPHALAESPLVRSIAVRERGGEDAVEALRALLTEAAEELRGGRREDAYYRALDATYLRPAPTQAVAAERMGLPFSTYRRHLRRGVDHVVGALWRRETGG